LISPGNRSGVLLGPALGQLDDLLHDFPDVLERRPVCLCEKTCARLVCPVLHLRGPSLHLLKRLAAVDWEEREIEALDLAEHVRLLARELTDLLPPKVVKEVQELPDVVGPLRVRNEPLPLPVKRGGVDAANKARSSHVLFDFFSGVSKFGESVYD
jgi:hypothetical protein